MITNTSLFHLSQSPSSHPSCHPPVVEQQEDARHRDAELKGAPLIDEVGDDRQQHEAHGEETLVQHTHDGAPLRPHCLHHCKEEMGGREKGERKISMCLVTYFISVTNLFSLLFIDNVKDGW